MDDLNAFGILEAAIDESFAPSIHLDSNDQEDPTCIDVTGGVWGVTFGGASGIGSDTNKYIIADTYTNTIYATSTKPAIPDSTKRLLITLVYETYTVETDEKPVDPPYEGTKVIVSWTRHVFGDIYDELPTMVSKKKYMCLQLSADDGPAIWDWVRAH